MSALPAVNDERLNEILRKVNDLAVLPHVVFKVLEISGSSEAPAAHMERAIVVDPGFSAKVLSLANSAGMGLPRRVNSIREAIAFLGFRQMRSLAMTVGVFDLFVGKTDKESLRRRAWWRHSIDTAVCCRWLASQCRKIDPDEAYTCGLLHFIGKTLLDRVGDMDYDLVTQVVEKGGNVLVAERYIYGCDHVQMAYGAIMKWGMPEMIADGVLYAPEPAAGQNRTVHAAVVAVASHLADLATTGIKHEDLSSEHAAPAWALTMLGYGPEDNARITIEGMHAISEARLQM